MKPTTRMSLMYYRRTGQSPLIVQTQQVCDWMKLCVRVLRLLAAALGCRAHAGPEPLPAQSTCLWGQVRLCLLSYSATDDVPTQRG